MDPYMTDTTLCHLLFLGGVVGGIVAGWVAWGRG